MSNTFIVTIKLNTTREDEKLLDKKLYSAYLISRKLTHHASTLLYELYRDHTYKELLLLYHEYKEKSAKKFIGQALNEMQHRYGLSKEQFEYWVKEQQHRYRKNINSHVAQNVSSSVWNAVSKCLYGNGKRIHQKKYMDFTSIEGKNNTTGIVLKDNVLRIGKQRIPLQDYQEDAYLTEAMTHRIKYCRLLRKPMGQRWHWYVQVILEGIPPQKHAFLEDGTVGIDQGVSTEAIVSENACALIPLSIGSRYEEEAAICQRKMDRSLRYNNPENYNEDGTVRKKPKKWKYSRRYRREQMRLKTIRRKARDASKQYEQKLCNQILEQYGSDIITEKMNYKSLAKRAASEKEELTPGKKKRFGASIAHCAPARFMSILKQKLGYMGKTVTEVDTAQFKASQYNHVTDACKKSELSERWKDIGGMEVQRDLYSAFLLRNADRTALNEDGRPQKSDREKCLREFTAFLQNQYECITRMLENGISNKAVFGF